MNILSLLRGKLPTIIQSSGIALGIILIGVGLLSLDNPLLLMFLVVAGIAVGSALIGVGVLVANSEFIRETRAIDTANIRAQTQAIHEMTTALKSALSSAETTDEF